MDEISKDKKLSIAEQYFYTLREKELLKSWFQDPCRLNNLAKNQRQSLYSMAIRILNGRQTFIRPYNFIYTVRQEIHPAFWFIYDINDEKILKIKAFIPKHHISDTRLKYTLAMQYLKNKNDTIGFRSYALSHSFPEKIFYNMFFSKHRLYWPSSQLISMLANEIPPEDWFIFPDEVCVDAVTPVPIIHYFDSNHIKKNR